jgi:hypothetical protein
MRSMSTPIPLRSSCVSPALPFLTQNLRKRRAVNANAVLGLLALVCPVADERRDITSRYDMRQCAHGLHIETAGLLVVPIAVLAAVEKHHGYGSCEMDDSAGRLRPLHECRQTLIRVPSHPAVPCRDESYCNWDAGHMSSTMGVALSTSRPDVVHGLTSLLSPGRSRMCAARPGRVSKP